MRWIPILLLAHVLVAAPGLKQRIDKILETSPAARRAHWGIHVADLATGKTVTVTATPSLISTLTRW